MISPKALIFSLVLLNAIFLLTSFFQQKLPQTQGIYNTPEPDIDSQQSNNYTFANPPLAYKVLSQLDVIKKPEGLKWMKRITKSYLGIKPDDNYCDKHRAYFTEHPESIFQQINVVPTAKSGTFRTEVISSIGNDLHGALNKQMTKKESRSLIHELKPETNVFFTTDALSLFFRVTQQMSCSFQESNQIPGQSKLSVKSKVAHAANDYIKKFEDRPHCMNQNKLFPQTYLLSNSAECKAFFENINSLEYQQLKEERKIVYIKKVPGVHRGLGVQPFTEEVEQKLKDSYKDGELCGKNKRNIIIQHYIHNPLLLKGRKFHFRMYLLIASVNPIIAYYHDGFLRVPLAEYDVDSKDNKALVTNLYLYEKIYKKAKKGTLSEGKTEEELKLAQQWSFDQLQAYLLETGVISDPNWLNNYLRPEFKKAMIHLVRLSSDNYVKHSSFYGLYGVDFMLDTNLNLWFLEANSGPAWDGYSQPMGKFIAKMLTDHFEIVVGLLRSRAKRAMNYVNKLIEEGLVLERENGEVVVENLEEKRKVFDSIMMNYFEKEFEMSEANGFAKIIDENEEGIDVYQGLVEKGCL